MDVDLGEMIRDNRYISYQLCTRGDRALAEQGLTGVQASVLLHILENSQGETSLTDLHREMGYSMSAASTMVKRLREKLEGASDQWNLKTVWGVGYKFEVKE